MIDEGALDKALTVSDKTPEEPLPWRKIYEVINNGHIKQRDVEFPKEFLLKCKTEYNVPHLIPVDIKNSTNWS